MKDRSIVLDRDHVYGRDVRIALALTLAGMVASFLYVKQPEVRPYELRRALDSFVLVQPPDPGNLPKPPDERVRSKMPIPSADGVATDPGVGLHRIDELHSNVAVTELPEIKFVWQVEKAPKLLYAAVPEYPEMARLSCIEGIAVVQVAVDTVGSASRVELYAGSGCKSLDDAALAAAQLCRFTPGYQGNRPVAVWVNVPFRFRLN